MIAPILRSKLEPIVATYRRFQLWRALTLCWCDAAAFGGLLFLLLWLVGLCVYVCLFVLLPELVVLWGAGDIFAHLVPAAIACLAVWIANRRRAIDYHWVA